MTSPGITRGGRHGEEKPDGFGKKSVEPSHLPSGCFEDALATMFQKERKSADAPYSVHKGTYILTPLCAVGIYGPGTDGNATNAALRSRAGVLFGPLAQVRGQKTRIRQISLYVKCCTSAAAYGVRSGLGLRIKKRHAL